MQSLSVKKITRELTVSRNTVREILRSDQTSSADQFRKSPDLADYELTYSPRLFSLA